MNKKLINRLLTGFMFFVLVVLFNTLVASTIANAEGRDDVAQYSNNQGASDELIKELRFNVELPIAGNKPKMTVTTDSSSKFTIEEPNEEHEAGDNVTWSYGSGENRIIMSKTDSFVAGRKYQLNIKIKAKANYAFGDKLTQYINGEYLRISDNFSKKETTKTYYFTCPTIDQNSEINITGINKPVEGEKPDRREGWNVSNPNCKIYSDSENIKWYSVSKDGTETEIKNEDEVEEDKICRLKLKINAYPSAENFFPRLKQDISKIKVNVEGADRTWINTDNIIIDDLSSSNSYIIVSADFKPIKPVKKININGYKPPIAGTKKSYEGFSAANRSEYLIYTSGDSSYVKNGVIWGQLQDGDNITSKVNESITFENGKEYFTKIFIKVAEGKIIPTDVNKIEAKVSGFDATVSKSNIAEDVIVLTVSNIGRDNISRYDYSIPAPVAGKKAGMVTFTTVPQNALNSSSQIDSKGSWQVSEDGKNYVAMKDGEIFEEGKYYRTNVAGTHQLSLTSEMMFGDIINTKVTYGISDKLAIYINGKNIKDEGILDDEGYFCFGKINVSGNNNPIVDDGNSDSSDPKSGKKEVIAKSGVAGKGSSVSAVEKAIKSNNSEKELKGSEFGKLSARATKTTKKSVTIKWNKVKGAKGYIIYGAKCGKYNYQKLASLKAAKTSFVNKKLKKGTYYKFFVVAYDSSNKVVTSSRIIHAATTGGKVGNAKTIKVTNVKKNKKSLKKSKTFKLKVKQVAANKKLKIKNHRKLSYETSNKKVATVTSKGKIKAVGKGSCIIYVYAQNGTFAKVKVRVK